MMNVFEPVRIKGKLVAKNTKTGEIAPKDLIRHIQLLNAEKNREVLFVASTGRVTRMPAVEAGVQVAAPAPSQWTPGPARQRAIRQRPRYACAARHRSAQRQAPFLRHCPWP